MTRQMSKGSQVAFAKAWLERQGIEAQTVDVQSYIDSSLSYEENIKSLKRMLGMSGRSTQKATRTMSAAECDVAIGNCQAGFVEDCRDACKCGDPDACDVKVPRKRAKPRTKIKKKKTSGVKPQKTTKTQAILTANCFWERSTAETEKNKEGEAVHSRTRQSIHSEMSDAPQRTIMS